MYSTTPTQRINDLMFHLKINRQYGNHVRNSRTAYYTDMTLGQIAESHHQPFSYNKPRKIKVVSLDHYGEYCCSYCERPIERSYGLCPDCEEILQDQQEACF